MTPLQELIDLQDDLILRINREKCALAMRTEQLVDLAARHLGDSTAQAYRYLLQHFEKILDRCNDELEEPLLDDSSDEEDEPKSKARLALDRLPSVTNNQLLREIPNSVDLASGLQLDEDSDVNGTSSHDLPNGHASEHDEDYQFRLRAEAKRKRATSLDQHLKILSEDPRGFVKWNGSNGGGEWKVDFRSLSQTLVQHQIETTITSRLNSEHARVFRVLVSKGKLDEKQVSTIAMFRPKDCRQALTCLHEEGLIEVQEVPRDNYRTPKSTIYLYHFNQNRVRLRMLDDIYKTQLRFLQRMKFERASVKEVIDRIEAMESGELDPVQYRKSSLSMNGSANESDDQDKEYSEETKKSYQKQLKAKKISEDHDRKQFKLWRAKHGMLMVQLSRLDELVAVFRDFYPPTGDLG